MRFHLLSFFNHGIVGVFCINFSSAVWCCLQPELLVGTTTQHPITTLLNLTPAKQNVHRTPATVYDVKGQGGLDSYSLKCHLLSTTNDSASVCNVEFVVLDKFIKYPTGSYNQSVDYPSLLFNLQLKCTNDNQQMRVKTVQCSWHQAYECH